MRIKIQKINNFNAFQFLLLSNKINAKKVKMFKFIILIYSLIL